jgi:IclR family pca regulon transcriptional regulator
VRRTSRTVTDVGRLREILADARRQGWTMVDQELEDGVRSIATALRGRGGRALAALNCSTHAGRVGLRELRTDFVPALLATAGEINARLAAR